MRKTRQRALAAWLKNKRKGPVLPQVLRRLRKDVQQAQEFKKAREFDIKGERARAAKRRGRARARAKARAEQARAEQGVQG